MTYNSDEMQRILQIAFARKQQGEVSREQIIEIASELGVSAASLQAAEQEWLIQEVEGKKRQMFNAQRRRELKSHVVSFIGVNGFLILLNLFTSPSYFWAIFPLLAWGLGLFLHCMKAYKTTGESYEHDFQEWCKGLPKK
ncbi:2TM domain-containing protein [Cylindrospermum sp. FACHB-282]|uniref:2TM domain-containing protein n=1 Tax=Cylindrospermum sp. FACHB-282 TaxID=2692794 RepID=UPI001683F357|nr:2TM domain-containing protein [Cylindrospermum sp. FACHB-282]MBD2384019.1 2TM domain-containing protein [Cylindrospermum sp. FACHB-282]